MVGRENEAFKQIMAQMDYERSGVERLLQNYPIYEKLLGHIKKMDKKKVGEEFYAWVRDSMAQLEIEFHIGRLLVYYTAWTIDQGRRPSKEAALAKAYCNQYEQRLNDLATRILGPSSLLREGTPWAAFDGELIQQPCQEWPARHGRHRLGNARHAWKQSGSEPAREHNRLHQSLGRASRASRPVSRAAILRCPAW